MLCSLSGNGAGGLRKEWKIGRVWDGGIHVVYVNVAAPWIRISMLNTAVCRVRSTSAQAFHTGSILVLGSEYASFDQLCSRVNAYTSSRYVSRMAAIARPKFRLLAFIASEDAVFLWIFAGVKANRFVRGSGAPFPFGRNI